MRRSAWGMAVVCAGLLVAGLPTQAVAANPGRVSVGYGTAGPKHGLTRGEFSRARPLSFPARYRHAPGRRSAPSGARPVVTPPSRWGWAPSLGSWTGGEAVAHAAYGGPQPAFPIWSEGYWPRLWYDGTVGRLYTSPDGQELDMCSATAVGPNVIVTAAHCVWDADTGQFMQWWLFAPAQYGSSLPKGIWIAHAGYIWNDYETAPSESLDYAFLTIYPSGGRSLGSVTGWHGMLLDSNQQQILSLGYPASGKFEPRCAFISCYQWACHSPLGEVVQDPEGNEVGMGCNSGEGSSGGPWLEPYNGTWYVASNVSTGVTFLPDPGYDTNQWGPYYDDSTLALFNYAKAHG